MIAVIKREKWGKKYVITAREGGKLKAWKKWDRSPIEGYKRTFKENRTFDANLKKTDLDKVTEYTYFSEKPTLKKKGLKYQYLIKGILKNGKELDARSQSHIPSYNLNDARAEALTSFFERLAETEGLRYDENQGRIIAKKKVSKIKEGVVWYEVKHPKKN